jgi:hypothetical protein
MATTTQQEIAQIEQERATAVDTFAVQQQMINSLDRVLAKIDGGTAGGTAYVQPVPMPTESSPNYVLYIAIGLVALLFVGKR